MYYIITNEWIGPRDFSTDGADKYGVEIDIATEPGRTNMSNEPCIEGWLGTTSDWHRAAHGAFETLEAARAAAEAQFGPLFAPQDDAWRGGDHVVETWHNRERAAAHVGAQEWLGDAAGDLRAELLGGKSVETLASELETEALSCDGTPAGVILHGTEQYLRSLLESDD